VDDVVAQVLSMVRNRLAEQLTVGDLAQMAMYSKFHFARRFRRATGLSPGRFLAAMRLDEAKRLLVTTSLSVADISHQVGYNSVGTFTSRFTATVGVPPTVFRRLRGRVPSLLLDNPSPKEDARDEGTRAVVTGTVTLPEERTGEAPTFVGLFRSPAAEGWPAKWALLHCPGTWSFQRVPERKWYVIAVSLAPAPPGVAPPAADGCVTAVGIQGPIEVRVDSLVTNVDIRLRPVRPTDPPILLALSGLSDPVTGEADLAAAS
jgi:AraC-like DNA-binding protein